MRRMAIRSRCYPLNPRRCLSELLRGIRRNFFRLSPCYGQVPYVLLTRAPVAGGSIATSPLPLDLHVLSLSLAFILSQDQTLRCCLYIFLFFFIKKAKLKYRPFVLLFLLLSQKQPSKTECLPGPSVNVRSIYCDLTLKLTECIS